MTDLINGDSEYIVYCYNPLEDNWTTLPPLRVKYFGLGEVNGKLVAIGGKKSDGRRSNDVLTYTEKSRTWKQKIPPMPTARHSFGVLSLQSALLVAGGNTASGEHVNKVEIFRADTAQWYSTDPLPIACLDISLNSVGNMCYALGGFRFPSHLNQVLCASIEDLLRNALPSSNTYQSSADKQPAWKTLAITPTYRPAAAVLAGNLLAIGGKETPEAEGDAKKDVHIYFPSTDMWIHFSDLPEPRSHSAVTVLSSTEILVIGGRDGSRVNTVYKGTLHLKL